MNLIVYSPTYLNAVVKESKPYNFKLQGYGDLKRACVGLGRANITEIMGFAVVDDTLSEDLSELANFIHKCNLISGKSGIRRRFVFGLKDTDGLVNFLKRGKYENLDFYSGEFEIMTDSFLKREVFGTILDSHLTPYKLNDSTIGILKGGLPLLKVVPVFPMPTLKVISSVVKRSSIVETETQDTVLMELKSVGELYVLLRQLAIALPFEEDTSVLEERIEALLKEERSLDSNLLYKFVKEGRVNVHSPIRRLGVKPKDLVGI